MKRILFSLAILAFAATSAPAAPQPVLPSSKQPVQVTSPYQRPVQQVSPYQQPLSPAPRTPAQAARPYQPPVKAPQHQPVQAAKPFHPPVKAPAPHQPAPAFKPFQQHAPLHGNVASKIYHASDCEYYSTKSATAAFASAREAERAGYRACKICEGKEGVATAKKHQQMQHKHLHGNPSTKTLHGPSCKFYNAKSSSARFESLEQAKRQGYHFCTLCEGK